MQTVTVYQEVTLDTPQPIIDIITADADIDAGEPVYYDAEGEATCSATETIDDESVATTMYAMALESVKSGAPVHILIRGDFDAQGLELSKKAVKAYSNIGIIARR